MFSLLRKKEDPSYASRRAQLQAAIDAAQFLKAQVERKNVPVVMDDNDAGYDMAIDEIIDIIDDYVKVLQKSLSMYK